VTSAFAFSLFPIGSYYGETKAAVKKPFEKSADVEMLLPLLFVKVPFP